MAVARLGYEIDSSGAVVAADNLDDMTAAAKRAEVGAGRLRAANTNAAVATSGLSRTFRQVTPQLSQVAQQYTATGQLGQAIAIQAADIGLAFGVVGTVLGAVAGIALPAVIGALSDATNEAEVFEDRLDSLSIVLDNLSDSSDLLELSVDELTERFGEQAAVVRGLIENLAQYRVSVARDSLIEFAELAQISTEQFSRLSSSVAGAAAEIEILERQGNAFSQVRIDEITADISREAERMGEQFGISADEAIILSQAFAELNSAATTEDINQELVDLNDLMDELGISTEVIPDELEQAIARMSELGILTAELEQTMLRVAEAASFAPGLNPSMGVDELIPTRRELGGRRRGGRSGGSRVDEFARDLEQLRESLRTEQEVINEWYAEQEEILNNQRAQEILGIEEHNLLKQRLEQEHLDRLSEINNGYHGTALDQAQTFFGDLATALQSSNSKLAAAAQAFAAVEALINAYRAFNQVLADPTLPWFAKIPAAAGVLAAGLNTVSAIKSLSGGSSGGGVGGGTSASSGTVAEDTTATPQQTRAIIQLQGLDGRTRFTADEIDEIIRGIQDASDDGVIIEGFVTA